MRTFCAVLALTVISCGAEVDNSPPPAPTPGAPTTTPPPSFTAAQTAATAARCATPHGVLETYATVPELVTLLSRAWFYCTPMMTNDLQSSFEDRGNAAPRVGLEFTTDGHFYYLSPDSSGLVARGQGISEYASYTIQPPDDAPVNNISFEIETHFPDKSAGATRATFETGPRRMALESFRGYFVPMSEEAP
jgi:hypothetical protein